MKLIRDAWLLLFIVMPLISPFAVLGAEPDDIIGLWDTADKDARIEIYKCELGYCGRIAYLEEPNYSKDDEGGIAGLPKLDRNNPNSALRKRPLVGLRFIEGFSYAGRDVWDGGLIYNPENGKTYKARITLPDNNRLMLRGYWGISLLGRTEIWVRSSSEPDRG